MESDAERSGGPDAAAAREALDGLREDGVVLSERVVTPWWYHPALGIAVAVIVTAQVLPPASRFPLLASGVLAMPALAAIYRRRYGVQISGPTGPRSRRMLTGVLAFLLAVLAVGVGIAFAGAPPVWILLPAVTSLIGVALLGRRYDRALRADLADPPGPRS